MVLGKEETPQQQINQEACGARVSPGSLAGQDQHTCCELQHAQLLGLEPSMPKVCSTEHQSLEALHRGGILLPKSLGNAVDVIPFPIFRVSWLDFCIKEMQLYSLSLILF